MLGDGAKKLDHMCKLFVLSNMRDRLQPHRNQISPIEDQCKCASRGSEVHPAGGGGSGST